LHIATKAIYSLFVVYRLSLTNPISYHILCACTHLYKDIRKTLLNHRFVLTNSLQHHHKRQSLRTFLSTTGTWKSIKLHFTPYKGFGSQEIKSTCNDYEYHAFASTTQSKDHTWGTTMEYIELNKLTTLAANKAKTLHGIVK
jgi:hypothetical protein